MISCDHKDISTLNVHQIPFLQYFENIEQEGGGGVVASRESVKYVNIVRNMLVSGIGRIAYPFNKELMPLLKTFS